MFVEGESRDAWLDGVATHQSEGQFGRTVVLFLRRFFGKLAEVFLALLAAGLVAIEATDDVGFGAVAERHESAWRNRQAAFFGESHRQMLVLGQVGVLNRLMEGFEGTLTTSQYAKLAKCSHDSALRDIQVLVDRHVLVQGAGGGRKTNYSLATPEGT